MRILLTGAHGFIGSALLKEPTTHEIIAAGRGWIERPAEVQWENFDALIHLAAAGVQRVDREWDECMKVNFQALQDMLNAIEKSGATPTIYLACTIFDKTMGTKMELWKDPYAVSKRLGTMYAQDWEKRYRGRLILDDIASCYQPGEVEIVAQRIIRLVTT